MAHLHIVRGLPGSGKSTYVSQKLDSLDHAWFEDAWFEADMFFEDEVTGEYKFDAKLIEQAHAWCYSNTIRCLRSGINVWVSNTFTRLWEMNPYMRVSDLIDEPVEISIIEMKTQFTSTHGVPEYALKAMKDRWEELPSDWKDKFTVEEIV